MSVLPDILRPLGEHAIGAELDHTICTVESCLDGVKESWCKVLQVVLCSCGICFELVNGRCGSSALVEGLGTCLWI